MQTPRLAILAGKRTRSGPRSPFLRFLRDHVNALRKFEIYATGGTAQTVFSTGLYDEKRLHFLLSGRRGGVVQLAAMVARGECAAVIFLTDPRDLWADVPENRALKRICIELNVRLVTTWRGAEEWALFEADDASAVAVDWCPKNWKEGSVNVEESEPIDLKISRSTIALISHDERKKDMLEFVDQHVDQLKRFDRILATGTTGWLLKIRHTEARQVADALDHASDRLGADRYAEIQKLLAQKPRKLSPCAEFSQKLMPLASGPKVVMC